MQRSKPNMQNNRLLRRSAKPIMNVNASIQKEMQLKMLKNFWKKLNDKPKSRENNNKCMKKKGLEWKMKEMQKNGNN